MALGNAYRFTMEGSESMTQEDFEKAGGNRSSIHVDFMIGSGELDVQGVLPGAVGDAGSPSPSVDDRPSAGHRRHQPLAAPGGSAAPVATLPHRVTPADR